MHICKKLHCSMINNGKFIISLDFELEWGVLGVEDMRVYGENVKGVQEVIPKTLSMFQAHNIHATFATVGFLFFKNKQALINNIPAQELQPHYEHNVLTQYGTYIENIADVDEGDIFHFAPGLIQQIKNSPGQEIGSHTFSHYYCLEKGQNLEMFTEDLLFAKQQAERNGLDLQSIVFPKNQYNDDYIKACVPFGIKVYRGNPSSSFLMLRAMEHENYFRKAMRLGDAYLNLSGHNTFTDEFIKQSFPYNIPGSRFLRPYSNSLRFFDFLKLKRIKNGMLHAAKNNETYHLWWHPHNFGRNQKENFIFLEKILSYYNFLNNKYGFKSYSMLELANELEKQKS